MNKRKCLFMRLALVVGLIVQCVLLQASTLIDGLYYDLDTSNRTATVTYEVDGTGNYASLPADVVIPESVEYNGVTFTVTKIADKAFANCKVMESISIPATVMEVGTGVVETYYDPYTLPFYNCTSLKKVCFEDGDNYIRLGSYGRVQRGSSTQRYYYTGSNCYGLFSSCPLESVYIGRNLLYSYVSTIFRMDIYSFLDRPENYGYSAFYNQEKLTKVTLSSKVTEIPQYLFYSCKSLQNLQVNGPLVSVPKYAFYGCNLVSLILPNSVKSIADYAFQDNVGMESAILGASVKTIGDYAFNGCTELSIVDLGSQLDSIGKYAFYKNAISSLNLPNSVKSMGEYCFAENKNLTSLTVGTECVELSKKLFEGCIKLSSVSLNTGLQRISESVFSNCTSLESISFPCTVKYLDKCAFYGDLSLKNVFLNEGLVTIGNAAFANCSSLESISIPGTVTQIGNYSKGSPTTPDSLAFYNCSSLKEVRFEYGVQPIELGSYCRYYYVYSKYGSSYKYDTDNSYGLFASCPLENVFIGRNIEYVLNDEYPFEGNPKYYGYSAFYNQPKLAKITISPSVTEIPPYLFYKNTAITMTELSNVKTIGNSAFEGCSKLTTLNFGQDLETVGGCAFQDCSNVTKLTFPDATTTIGNSAFANCKSLTTVTFDDDKNLIEMAYGSSDANNGLFRDCPVETLYLGRWLSYNTEQPTRSPFYSIAELKNLTFGKYLKVVDKYMFSYCTGLENVYIPDSITSVNMWAFRGCSALKSVRFSENLSQIGDYGFSECTSLDNVAFPASMTSTSDNSFSNCTSLRNLDLGKSLLVIGPSAFENDSILGSVNIPETVYGLGVGAFKSCVSLPYVKISKGELTTVSKESFKGCTGLEWISLSENISSLGENAFEGCTNIKYVKSYAMTPPEGLVNFPSEVESNGTLFVPEDNDEYPDVLGDYQYSPTWENWGSFKRITENTLLSSLTLNQSDAHLKVGETLTLDATVGPDAATNKKIDWKSDDETIATVSEDGVVAAHKVGQTSIHAIANDGGGAKAICAITVDPTLVSTIALSHETLEIRKNHQAQLSATVAPTNATNANYVWSSSNENVAKVSEDGVISAVTPGDAIIKATAQDGSLVEASCQVKVLPVLKGDSNDDDEVNVVDAVNTVNYILNKVTGTFAFESADVNSDGNISVSDVTGTTDLIMQQVLQAKEQVAMAKGYGISTMDASSANASDYLVLSQQDKSSVDISLDNNGNFAALQADITLPVNVNDVDVKLNGVMAATHQMSWSKLDAHTLRIVVYSLSNSTFIDGQAIFSLSSKKNLDAQEIRIANAIGSDVEAKGYRLASRFNDATSIGGVSVNDDSVKAVADGLIITGSNGTPIYIYTTSGILVKSFSLDAEVSKVALQTGVYLVKMNGQVVKVTVK